MQKNAILTANALLGGGFMGENQGRALKNEQDMLALAEELAARFPPAAKCFWSSPCALAVWSVK